MSSINTRKSDIVWNYIGTIVSMASGFVLLPLLMHFLSSSELGLWYVYVALSNFAMLFEFGFNPTFARNIVYVISGAQHLSIEGCDIKSVQEGIDWHLLNTVIKALKSYICNPRCCSFSSALDDRLSVHIVCGFWNGFIRYLGLLGSILRISVS